MRAVCKISNTTVTAEVFSRIDRKFDLMYSMRTITRQFSATTVEAQEAADKFQQYIVELASARHALVGGDDFKMKFVLMDFLISAGFKPESTARSESPLARGLGAGGMSVIRTLLFVLSGVLLPVLSLSVQLLSLSVHAPDSSPSGGSRSSLENRRHQTVVRQASVPSVLRAGRCM